MSKKIKFIITLVIPLIVLLSLVFTPFMTYLFGTEVLLGTQPVDPRDIFRGDYVSLNFDISSVDKSLVDDEINELAKGKSDVEDVYVLLELDSNNVASVKKVQLDKPTDELYLKGRIYMYELNYSSTITIEYQIDRYFVPQNTGKELEDKSRTGNIIATVKIYKGFPLLIDIKGE